MTVTDVDMDCRIVPKRNKRDETRMRGLRPYVSANGDARGAVIRANREGEDVTRDLDSVVKGYEFGRWRRVDDMIPVLDLYQNSHVEKKVKMVLLVSKK